MRRTEKQRELLRKSCQLKGLILLGNNYEKQQEIRKEQDKAYKMWQFYKGINNAISRR